MVVLSVNGVSCATAFGRSLAKFISKAKRYVMLELVKKCKFCRREMSVSPVEWLENPWCNFCLEERIEIVAPKSSSVEWKRAGNYFIFARQDKRLSCAND